MSLTLSREAVPEPPNPLGLAGIEFVETARHAAGAGPVLETLASGPWRDIDRARCCCTARLDERRRHGHVQP